MYIYLLRISLKRAAAVFYEGWMGIKALNLVLVFAAEVELQKVTHTVKLWRYLLRLSEKLDLAWWY